MLAMGNRLKNKNDFRAPTPAEIHRHREGPSHAPAAIAASHGSATAGGGGVVATTRKPRTATKASPRRCLSRRWCRPHAKRDERSKRVERDG